MTSSNGIIFRPWTGQTIIVSGNGLSSVRFSTIAWKCWNIVNWVLGNKLQWQWNRYPMVFEHDNVIKWKHFPRYWPFLRGIRRSPVTDEFPSQRPVTRRLDVFLDLRPNRLSKQIETPAIWDAIVLIMRHCNMFIWQFLKDSQDTFTNIRQCHFNTATSVVWWIVPWRYKKCILIDNSQR